MAKLTTLPVELVEQICQVIDDSWHAICPPQELYDLRLTCKDIHAKTIDFFASRVFRSMSVRLTTKDLRRLETVTQLRVMAGAVRIIMFWSADCEQDEKEFAQRYVFVVDYASVMGC